MYYLLYTVCVALLQQQTASTAIGLVNAESEGTPNVTDHFLYFAYGSNLLKERLQLNNPSATFFITGVLKDHVVRFGYYQEDFNSNNSWHGGVATIEERKGENVWGVIWKMAMDSIPSLDEQEGVAEGMYSPVEVSVDTIDGASVCRSYQMNNFTEFLPSPQYKQVVSLGARQNGLPLEYIKKLDAVVTNSYCGPSTLDDIKGLIPDGTSCQKQEGKAEENEF